MLKEMDKKEEEEKEEEEEHEKDYKTRRSNVCVAMSIFF